MTTIQQETIAIRDSPARERWSFPLYFIVCLGLVYFFIAFDLVDGKLFSGDTDDLLRKLEIANLVKGAGWFDLSFPSIQMPDVYVTPWSRLVDLPYALIAWSFQPLVGRDPALEIAFNLWPPIMAVFYALAVIGILGRMVPGRAELPIAVLMALLLPSTFAIWEFSPGRVDHHNVQILLLLALVYGLARWDRRGGIIAGAAVSAAMAVGLETLPVLAVALSVVCLAWMLGSGAGSRMLRWLGISCAVSSLALLVALVEPSSYLVMRSDTFSAPYVSALVGFGVVTAALTWVFPGDRATLLRSAALVLGGIAVLLAILWQYPAMLEGPLPMIKGLAKTYWFDRIDQEMSAMRFFATSDSRAILHLLAIIAIVILSAPAAIAALRRGDPVLPCVFAVMFAALAVACISGRFLRISLGLVPLLLPVAVNMLRSSDYQRYLKQIPIAVIAVLFLAAGTRIYILPPPQRSYDAFDYFIMNDCRDYSFAKVGTLPAGRMLTPPALGLQIIAHDPGKVSVSSVSFHRSSPSISNALAIAMAPVLADNAARLKDFDYLAVCRSQPGVQNSQQLPLFEELLSGRPVIGLDPITGPSDAVMIFRIDHAAIN